MTVYRLTPEQGASVLRCAGNLARATARGLREFPAGLRSVDVVDLHELAELAASGVPLPVAARQRLEVYKATQRERAKAAAKVAAIREAVREKAAEKVRAKREEEQARKEAEKAQRRAAKAAEKRRKVLAERRGRKQTQAAQEPAQAAAVAPVHTTSQAPTVAPVIDPEESRLPWED